MQNAKDNILQFFFLLATLLIFVAGCERKTKRGALVITSKPMGANVYVDDNLMGTTPLTLKDVPTGSYRVKMELEHYEIWRGNMDVKHQQSAEVRAELEPKPGTLEAKSEPSGAKVSIDGKASTKMILIPAGEFIMGSPEGEGDDDERSQHTVFLDAFYIDKYEVTNAQYKQFINATGHEAPDYWNDERFNQPNQPVVDVSWHDAVAYAKWAGKRLPTEAEWEKSARGTDGRKYPWGNKLGILTCNSDIDIDGYQYTAPVGSFPDGASPYGVMDMAGNVWEWCADWYDSAYYSRSPQQNPKGPDSGSTRVLRGGSWNIYPYLTFLCCATRLKESPDIRSNRIGFRCVRDVTP